MTLKRFRSKKSKRRSASQWAVSWRKFRKNKTGLTGLFIVLFFIFVGLMSDYLAPYPPRSLQPLYNGEAGQPPSWKHPFGTTVVGVDVYSDVIHSTRNDLFVGVVATGISTLIAILVGAFSGYFGGKTDNILMRITEVFIVFPAMMIILVFARILLLVVVAGFGLLIIVFILGLFGWPSCARMIRGEILKLKQMEFIRAEKVLGSSAKRIIFRHILPNVFSSVIVVASLGVATNILMEAGIGFLGFGDPNTVTWGVLLQEGYVYLRLYWWAEFFPGMAVFLSVLGFNLLGDGLNDALNPKLRE